MKVSIDKFIVGSFVADILFLEAWVLESKTTGLFFEKDQSGCLYGEAPRVQTRDFLVSRSSSGEQQ